MSSLEPEPTKIGKKIKESKFNDKKIFFLDKTRNLPLGKPTSGYRDVLFIEAAEEIFEEYYIPYVKKGNNTNGTKNSKTKLDFYIKLTKGVNKTETTTPLESRNKCQAAKNWVSTVEANITKLTTKKSGFRDDKNPAENIFIKKFSSICITEELTEQ